MILHSFLICYSSFIFQTSGETRFVMWIWSGGIVIIGECPMLIGLWSFIGWNSGLYLSLDHWNFPKNLLHPLWMWYHWNDNRKKNDDIKNDISFNKCLYNWSSNSSKGFCVCFHKNILGKVLIYHLFFL